MKKLFTVLFLAGAMSIVACGPSEEDKAKADAAEQAKKDSIALNAASMELNTADSTATPDTTQAAPAAPTTEEHK